VFGVGAWLGHGGVCLGRAVCGLTGLTGVACCIKKNDIEPQDLEEVV
jgi:hypothetical protein